MIDIQYRFRNHRENVMQHCGHTIIDFYYFSSTFLVEIHHNQLVLRVSLLYCYRFNPSRFPD